MELQTGLWQNQSLKLAMTQELKQAIELLAYSAEELAAFLEAEAMENPLIKLEHSYLTFVDSRIDISRKQKKQSFDQGNQSWIEQVPQTSGSLYDALFFQISMKALPKREERIIKQFIYHLDLNGYFAVGMEDAAAAAKISLAEAEECLQLLQTLEPAGVGARTLQECLLIQIERNGRKHALAEPILSSHFLDFAEKRWRKLSKELKVSTKEIQEAADYIRTLNPRPGARFSQASSEYVIPDLIVIKQDMNLELHLFEKHLPSVTFQKDYYRDLSMYRDRQVQKFLKEKARGFRTITKTLDQRRKTIYEVGMALLEQQRDFFLKGPFYLKPLTLKEVADQIGVHESTVSRAVKGKYIQTPHGTFEMKKFFSAALAAVEEQNESQASAAQVKNKIIEMVRQENKMKPLSDQNIADAFKRMGIMVSRRTIAKYREQLTILPSSKRKRYE
ncbi:RNA polymerase factor sigma-54 [Heyndrickxia acidicola]|uniref:RNA polymerase factor sigma-54 n=1 Tax=Heyndrickxia acidicola TaxID=209389 RepID=A0ABU6MHA9_9BACI|nr:RNA polymerase factor sigma-54 [Heyndrickxia acidicola]MED1203782.1 RNA polymerase factor sigma-54 [Heyndrickxia acidicola]